MSSWSTLSRSLVQLETEVRSSKPALRCKALERLKSLLDTRDEELVQLFQGRLYTPETTWLSLVDSVHEACVQQTSRLEESQDGKGLSAAEGKNRDHIAVLQKLVVLANRDRTNVKHSVLFAKAIHCFGNRWMVRYFGTCYLQVLYENVLQDIDGGTKEGLEELKLGEWSSLLSCCFRMFDSVHIQRLTLLQCMPPIIEHGCQFTYLSADLVQYLPKLEEIVATGNLEVNALGELIRLIFIICANLALDYRLTVCQHLENILDHVINAYSSRMSDRSKRTLFQLLHLAVAVHSPEGNVCASTNTSYTANRTVWHRHLRNMLHLMHTEIQQQHSELTRLQTNPRQCPVFSALGAALCAVLFWDSSVWSETDGGGTDGEPTRKRQRRPERLNGVMDAAETQKDKFCWRWMAILADLMATYPSSLEAPDFQPLLHMLHQFQLVIQYPVEVEILGRLVDILLRVEAQLGANSDRIDRAFCDDLWYKIAQNAFRTTSATLQQGNVDLMRRLVVHKRCLPDTFLTTVLRTFLSDAIRRSNAAVRLLIAILRHNNIDALDQADVKEMRYATLAWLHRQKIVLVNTERIEPMLVAELTVLCVLTKIDATVVERLDAAESEAVALAGGDFATFLLELKSNLLFKSLRKLIIVNRVDGAQQSATSSVQFHPLPQANNLLSVIDDQHFERLFEILNPDREIPEQQDSLIPFNAVTSTLILYLHLLDRLIAYAALDRERLDKTFLAKKCTFKLEQLEMCLAKFSQHHSFSVKDTMDVLERLRAIFETPLHPMLVGMMRSRELVELIGWLRRWLGGRQRDSQSVILRSIDQLNDTNTLRYEAFAVLAHLAEGANEQLAFAALDEFDWNLRNNTDVLIVVRLLRILMRQRSTEEKAEWCFGHVKTFCQNYYRNQQLTEILVDLIPDLVRYIHPYAMMTDDLVQLLISFLALAKKRKYGPHITEKLIRSLISVASAYPTHIVNDDMAALYLVLNRFTAAAQPLRVQYATIQTLSYILDADWLRSFAPHNDTAAVSLKRFQQSMFEVSASSAEGLSTTAVNVTNVATNDACGDIDRTSRTIGVRVQHLSAVIAVSPMLRPQAWFQLMEFCHQHELSADFVSAVVCQLCTFMGVERDVFVAENMPRLLAQWLRADYPVEKFPWFVDSSARSLIDFCRLHQNLWVQGILQSRPAALAGFGQLVDVSCVRDLLEPIIAECLAYLLPFHAKCPNMSHTYTERAKAMATILEQNVADASASWRSRTLQIVQHLLCNAWDTKQFRKWFQFEVDSVCDEHMVNATNFDKCLAFVQSQTISTPASTTLLLHFCNVEPYKMFQLIQHMKHAIQRARLVEQKLLSIYQYAVLAQHLLEFLGRETITTGAQKTASENVKLFFARDICNYMCNLLVSTKPSQFSLAVLELLHASCARLLPKRVQYVRMHFHFIVSTLLSVAASTTADADHTRRSPMSAAIFAAALRCLRLLIVDQQQALSAEIALLDNFPAHLAAFDELREAHATIKYRRKEFTLCDELECFLRVVNRKTEGLAALREQLSSKKSELAAVYRQHAESIGTAANAEHGSSLHRLVVSLLQTVKSAEDTIDAVAVEQKWMEAAKCLGELGPSDLGTLVLQPDAQMHTYRFFATFDGATKHFCRVVMDALNELLWHTNVGVMQAASEALVFLLEHKSAQEVDNAPNLGLFHSATPRTSSIYAIPKQDSGLKLELIFAEHMHSEHSVWIKAVVKELFAFFGDETLAKVATIHTPFAECALPLLVQMLLTCSLPGVLDGLRQSVIGFFDIHQTSRAADNANDSPRPLCLNWASIKAMLNVVECIRMYNLYNQHQKMQLNYLNVALAAQYCEAHFTAVLYADLWAMEQPSPKVTRSNHELQLIMREAHTSIGEPDAVHAFIDPIANRRDYLQFNQSWSYIFLEQDVLPYAEPAHLAECLSNLRAAGQYGLCNSLSKISTAANNSAAQYECAWRLGDWSILDDVQSPISAGGAGSTTEHMFDQAHYKALHCLQIKDELGTKLAIGRARRIVINDLRSASLECTHNLYRHLQRLALVQQIDDFLPVQFQHHTNGDHSVGAASNTSNSQTNIIAKWRAQDRIAASAFRTRETLLAQRITILRSAGVRATRRLQNTFNVPADVQQTMLLDVAREARHEGQLNMAVRYLAVLNGMPALSNQAKSGLWLEDAQLNWQRGDRMLAKRLIQQSLSNTDPESSLSRASALRIYGECLADTQSSDTRTLIDKYFLNSLKLLGTIEVEREPLAARMRMPATEIGAFVLQHRRRAYEAIGKYADQEYGRIGQHMRSAQFVQKRQSVVENQRLVAVMGSDRDATRDQKCTRTVLHRNTDIDRKEIAATEAELAEYLQLAVKYYVCACTMAELATGEAGDGSVIFRIVSLWLANQTNEAIVRELRQSFKKVASWQFMTVLPQVAARITNVTGDFGDTVMEMMERCAIDHPQQTIYQILALANAYVDDTTASNRTAKSSRVLGASMLIDRLKKNEKTMLVVSQMSEMCKALIGFANKDVVDKKHISSKEPIRKLANLNYVHCPTLELPISKTANYPQLITVQKWSDVLTMVGGINAPKKVTCLCSNGRTYPQLLKGKDDLRQDAIMQQVFTILNTMLATNRDTRKARLMVKTYRVVPLTQRSGILEWCANTLPLAVYLAGSTEQPGAHERFHPKDLKPNYCRKVISSYNRDQKPIAEKVAIFKKVCEQFRPALQYFFLERFARPGEWFERRLAYTKSVATTSMVGYILGIGDRHVSNILIDETTAELVHIDFGIAFEQSKCLPTPETVPFRLTRDMVAAIGCSGVDGIFRRSCERTMDVLRQNKRTIITILEVLLYDPLYAWALTARQVSSRQSVVSSGADDGTVVGGDQKNVMAERALIRLEAKLDGKEEGAASGSTGTVEAHVELLIAQATNPYNLCRLFEGWQAYL